MTVIEHHGVKGMHWGTHKVVSPRERLKQIEKQKDKFDGNKIVRGAELTGWAINKGSKHPSRRAIQSVVTRGTLEVAAVLAVGNIAINHAAGSPRTKQGGRIAVAMMAAQVGKMRIDDIRSVRQFTNHDKLITEEAGIKKQLKKTNKK